jgi:hypothetical protein
MFRVKLVIYFLIVCIAAGYGTESIPIKNQIAKSSDYFIKDSSNIFVTIPCKYCCFTLEYKFPCCGWKVLIYRGVKSEIIPVDLQVIRWSYPHDIAHDEIRYKGMKVSNDSSHPYIPLFLVANLAAKGEPRTVYADTREFNSSPLADTLHFSLGKLVYTLTKTVAYDSTGNQNSEVSAYELKTSGKSQVAFEKILRIVWVGDIDMDGKLDFLVNTEGGDGTLMYDLWLSSKSENSQLIKRVARVRMSGCD